MAVYEYSALDNKGRTTKGVIEADSQKQAKSRLKSQGVFVTKISESRKGRTVTAREKAEDRKKSAQPGSFAEKIEELSQVNLLERFQNRISLQDVVIFSRQLATLLSAHLPLVQSLNALSDQTESPSLKRVITEVKDQVNEGSSLANAMRKHPKVFPPLYTNMIQSGESSGSLEVVCRRLADFLESQLALNRKVSGAMIYPAILILLATSVVAFMMTAVMPKILTIFESQGQTLPLPTRVLQAVSNGLVSWWWLFAILAGTGIYFFQRWRHTPKGRETFDAFMLRVPIFGTLIRKVAIARFTRTLSTLLTSGITILQALDITKNVLNNVVLENAIANARESISEGTSIAGPLKASGVFPPIVTHMVLVGEQSGELEQMLLKVADTYDDEVSQTISTLTTLLEPVIIVIMAVVILIIVIAVLLPIIQMTSAIKA